MKIPRTVLAALLPLLLALAACSTVAPPSVGDVDGYLVDLGSWTDFSPPLPTQEPQPDPDEEPTLLDETTESTPIKDEDGEVVRHEAGPDEGEPVDFQDVTYTCTETPYNLTSNPSQIVMYNPDASILWAGSLIQGQSYARGIGGLEGLTIAERAPIEVVITDFFNDNPSELVVNPSLGTVTDAIGRMVGNAEAQDLATPSTISFDMRTFHSESDFAAAFNVSGNYLGFSASASGSVDNSRSKTTVAVNFRQQMFTVSVPPPQTPGSFFSDAFTGAKLQEQIDLGRIGPSNLPVYVSEIVYGRMMMFTMTSTASESEIRGAISAAYNGIGGGGSGSLSAAPRTVLNEAEIRITSYGGDADATIAMIRSGNWQDYFTDTAPLTSAKPMSYTFRNLSDGTIAKVSEAGSYNIRECSARIAAPGTFDFGLVQRTDDMPLETPYRTLIGDFDGDDNDDLLFNHLGTTENEVMLAFGTGLGTFDIVVPEPNPAADPDDPENDEPPFIDVPIYFEEHPEIAVEGWGNYEARIVDLNGDDLDDIVWNVHITGANRSYAAIAQVDGDGNFTGFDFTPVSKHWNSGAGGWELYTLLTGDVNGDDRDDLIWTYPSSTTRTYVGLSNGDGSFDTLPFQDHLASTFSYSTPLFGNVNGDIYGDLIWDSGTGSAASALGQADGTFVANGVDNHVIGGTPYAANIDDDGVTDIVVLGFVFSNNTVQVARGDPIDGFTPTSAQSLPFQDGDTAPALFTPAFPDVNGDGRDDLIYTGPGDSQSLGTNSNIKRIFVGLGTDGTFEPFDTTRIYQDHPQLLNWSTYSTHFGDVNGDGLEDIVWVFEGVTNRIFVGLAKNE